MRCDKENRRERKERCRERQQRCLVWRHGGETQEGELEVGEVKTLSRTDQIRNEDMRGTERV